jgi:hypothetical protein
MEFDAPPQLNLVNETIFQYIRWMQQLIKKNTGHASKQLTCSGALVVCSQTSEAYIVNKSFPLTPALFVYSTVNQARGAVLCNIAVSSRLAVKSSYSK